MYILTDNWAPYNDSITFDIVIMFTSVAARKPYTITTNTTIHCDRYSLINAKTKNTNRTKNSNTKMHMFPSVDHHYSSTVQKRQTTRIKESGILNFQKPR